MKKLALTADEEKFWDQVMNQASNERTDLDKADDNNIYRVSVTKREQKKPAAPSIRQWVRKVRYATSLSMRRAIRAITQPGRRVQFDISKNETRSYQENDNPAQIQDQGWRKGLMHLQRMTQKVAALYDSGADGHYISKNNRKQANMPAVRKSIIQVGVANGKTSQAVNITRLPFKGMSDEATRADTFDDFKNSLLSVGKFADDGITSILTKDGVTVHKEEDVLITCKGKPLLIGCRDQDRRYCIPLVQQNGKWKPRTPTK